MLSVKGYDNGIYYLFVVTDGTENNTYQYNFSKQPPDGVDAKDYLQQCKKESVALAQHEIDLKQPPKDIDI